MFISRRIPLDKIVILWSCSVFIKYIRRPFFLRMMVGSNRPGFCSADNFGSTKPDLSSVNNLKLRDEHKRYLFPYAHMRPIQKDLILKVVEVISGRKHLIVHAPTGLGKTVATLAPALKYAIDNGKKVLFLTSRQTQHLIAIDTLRAIKDRFDPGFTVVDIIGKKWMCSEPGVERLYSNEFTEFCKKQREENKCEFYSKTKKGLKLTTEAKLALERIRKQSPCHVEKVKEIAEEEGVCAYEISSALAKESQVIVADYYYVFNPKIRDLFFSKIDLDLSDCIVIVDEAHNLPDRIRKLMTVRLTNNIIKRGISEAKKLEDPDLISLLSRLQDVLNHFSSDLRSGSEKIVSKLAFIDLVSSFVDYDEFVASLDLAAQIVRKDEKQSYLSSIASFLDSWKGDDEGYVRLVSQSESSAGSLTTLSYRCLDPATVTRSIIDSTHSTILMSGTLTPTSMYKDLLGFPEDVVEVEYASPFPEKNRLSLVVPETTTKYSMRSPDQFKRIAHMLARLTDLVPGNSAVFFPSYYLRDQVYKDFVSLAKKTVLLERSEMTKEDRMEFLENFKAYQKTGAVLFAVVSGSFGEGIDFPGDLLKCVIVVGLPLQTPTLETKKLIEYYDMKFGKGWDYGYVTPAFTKCLQSAGRCIRSETDRGLVVFLDERFAWNNYLRKFPSDWDIKISKHFEERISDFFGL